MTTKDNEFWRKYEAHDRKAVEEWLKYSQSEARENISHIHLFSTGGTEEQVRFGADIQHDARFSPDGAMIVYCRAPSMDGPWQLWITDLASDDLDSIQITNRASNRLPDWHQTEA